MNFKCRMFILGVAFIIVSFLVIMTGCGGKSGSANVSINSTAPLDEKYQENPALLEADIYAEHYGVTEQEALNRFDISDAFSGVDTNLELAEPATFAGLWIQHEPIFCVVLAFTRDGEEAVKKYVSENLTAYVQVRTVKYSYRELQAAQSEVMNSFQAMGIPFEGAIYVQENCVEFRVTDRTEIDKAIAESRLVIPECVRIVVVKGLSVLL